MTRRRSENSSRVYRVAGVMTITPPDLPDAATTRRAGPFSLVVEPIARLLNCELVDDPTYDGLELQWFDDPLHGTGMLAFLSRRADRTVDYYQQPGLRLDPAGYAIGAGTGTWTVTDFEVARLEIAPDGVDAEVVFTDVDGRTVEVRIDDRDGRRRHRARLLAPIGSTIDHPNALLLVWLGGFDLVRTSGPEPLIRIGGRNATTSRLPGTLLHRRRLIKYSADVHAIRLNPAHDGHLPLPADATGTGSLAVHQSGGTVQLELSPSLPPITDIADDTRLEGAWNILMDESRLAGGRWWAERAGDTVRLGLEVEKGWRPGSLPGFMRFVTRVARVFRHWPTTYRWRATVTLADAPTMTSNWQRTTGPAGEGGT